MLRASMAALTIRFRRMIGDPAGTDQTWDDDALQDALDFYQSQARYLPLTGRETYAPGGLVSWFDFYADSGDWEDDVQLCTVNWGALAPATSDLLVGHWTFTVSQLPTIYLTGKAYDLAGAAADVLEMWATQLKLQYDFQAHLTRYQRSQKMRACLELADQYRRRQKMVAVPQIRGDV